jgi:brefeldin A-inhibited guanine nucleotide-exchange protein
MVLSRVSNVKSGWKSVFMVFTAAAADERKNIVLLAFETMEKIVREYFPYITETETATFTDCVRCLITFTNSRFNSDVSFNAIAFLRFCAVKLADGGLVSTNPSNDDDDSSTPLQNDDTPASDAQTTTDKDENVAYWMPLLTGLSRLTSDPRSAIRRSAVEVLFNILKDHGQLFTRPFWSNIFNTVIFPIFKSASVVSKETHFDEDQSPSLASSETCTWDSETSTVAAQCLVDLFVNFYNVIRSQLPGLTSILSGFVRSTVHTSASTGVSALLRFARELGFRLSEDEWDLVFHSLKEAAASTLPGLLKLLRTLDTIQILDYTDVDMLSGDGFTGGDSDDDNLQTAAYVVSRVKSHIATQLLIIQVITDLYSMHHQSLYSSNITILIDNFALVVNHANQLDSEKTVQLKLQKACTSLDISEPPIVHFQNEAYQSYIKFLNDVLMNNPFLSEELNIEPLVVSVCEEAMKVYLECARSESDETQAHKSYPRPVSHWILPVGSEKKDELAARSCLVVSALRVLIGLGRGGFKRYASRLFPLMVDLVSCEHSSSEVQRLLSNMFNSCVGPIIMRL